MRPVYPLAIRFADLWAVDHHQMVDEIYSPTIHMESMCRLDHRPVESSADLHDLEDRLASLIPQHRHELVRVLAGRAHACLETTVVSPTTGEYAPACVWWWLDGTGLVGEEVGFFDWDRRTTDPHRSHGFVPSDGQTAFGLSALVDALRAGALAEHLGDGCVVESPGGGPCAVPVGRVDVQEVVADGPVTAALIVSREDRAVWRATVVMTAGPDGRLVSVRCYGDPTTAVAVDAVHPAMRLDRRPTP